MLETEGDGVHEEAHADDSCAVSEAAFSGGKVPGIGKDVFDGGPVLNEDFGLGFGGLCVTSEDAVIDAVFNHAEHGDVFDVAWGRWLEVVVLMRW